MKKTTRFLALAIAAIMVFTACAGGAATPSGSAATAPANSSAADQGAASLGQIEDGAKLVYWSMWNEAEPQGMVIQQAIDAFTDATGVKVEINFNGRDIRKTLEPALASGETIDLFDEDIDRVLNIWGDYLLPLDDYMNAVYEDTNGKPYRAVVNNTLIKIAEASGESKKFADGGKIHNAPYQPFAYVVMYNSALFKAAGITAAPQTWDEFLAVCAKLKDSGVTPITVDDAYMGTLFGYTMSRVVGYEKCYEMVDNKDFSDPSVLRAAQIWEDLAKKGYISSKAATNVFPAGQVDEIAKGTVAMYLNGTWLPNEIYSQAPDFEWGSFAFPAIDPAGDGPEANNVGGQAFGVHKDTQYPNAAFALVRWLTVGEWDQKLSDESRGVPMANDAVWPVQLTESKVAFDNTTVRLRTDVGMQDDPETIAAIKDALSKLIIGQYTAQQFADALATL